MTYIHDFITSVSSVRKRTFEYQVLDIGSMDGVDNKKATQKQSTNNTDNILKSNMSN
ncbi:hypothetical protein B7P43_G11496 [Cryptotermes secundus]|uniref:Uncharacterized protein n=1 Tax=Cryptotermes secundus TaxID=105785 RepID=A0A2J7RRJ9_9NEOP|nr:hypothetical protein B7P43_G11496 [Cryptotermes secundus]